MRFRYVQTNRLTPRQRDEMYSLMSRYYENISQAQFNQDLAEKSDVILLLGGGRIQGFSTVLRFERKIGQRRISGIFSGDTVLNKDFWGNRALTVAFGLYLSKLVLGSPLRTHYWFLMSKGYKTYLLMTNNTLTHFPRWTGPTPPNYSELIDQFYGDRFGADYDSRLGLIFPTGARAPLKKQVADIEPRYLHNPNIRFFAETNPRWNEGVELACVSAINLQTVAYFTVSLALRQVRSLATRGARRVLRLRPARI